MTDTYTSDSGRRFAFNEIVVVEMLLGVPAERRIGRLVQVRLGAGAFGSDLCFVRLRDGSLVTFENVLIRSARDRAFEEGFYRSNGTSPPAVGDESGYPSDEPGATYLVRDGFPETGFVVAGASGPPARQQSFAITTTTGGGG